MEARYKKRVGALDEHELRLREEERYARDGTLDYYDEYDSVSSCSPEPYVSDAWVAESIAMRYRTLYSLSEDKIRVQKSLDFLNSLHIDMAVKCGIVTNSTTVTYPAHWLRSVDLTMCVQFGDFGKREVSLIFPKTADFQEKCGLFSFHQNDVRYRERCYVDLSYDADSSESDFPLSRTFRSPPPVTMKDFKFEVVTDLDLSDVARRWNLDSKPFHFAGRTYICGERFSYPIFASPATLLNAYNGYYLKLSPAERRKVRCGELLPVEWIDMCFSLIRCLDRRSYPIKKKSMMASLAALLTDSDYPVDWCDHVYVNLIYFSSILLLAIYFPFWRIWTEIFRFLERKSGGYLTPVSAAVATVFPLVTSVYLQLVYCIGCAFFVRPLYNELCFSVLPFFVVEEEYTAWISIERVDSFDGTYYARFDDGVDRPGEFFSLTDPYYRALDLPVYLFPDAPPRPRFRLMRKFFRWMSETYSGILFAVILEELVKLSGYGLFFLVSFETVGKCYLVRKKSFRFLLFPLATMVFHCGMFFGLDSFWLKVFLHFIWNFISFSYGDWLFSFSATAVSRTLGISDEDIRSVAWILDLLRKLYFRDKNGLLLSFAMNLESVGRLLEFTVEQVSDGLMDLVAYSLRSSEGVSDVPLSDEEPRLLSLLKRFLPKWVTRSPTYAAIVGVVVLVSGSTFFDSMEQFWSIFQRMSPFPLDGSVVDVVLNAIVSFYKGICSVIESRDWRAFFYMPKDVRFVAEASKLLYEEPSLVSEEVYVANAAHMQRLVDSRLYENNSTDISIMLVKLNERKVSLLKRLRDFKYRVPPRWIFLTGPPGTGKTTLASAIIDRLSVEDGVVRCPGDTINYSIYDKYPASSGIHPDARYFVINDLPDDYTNFPKLGLMSLEILLQRLIDVYPFDLPAAAVEDKGIVLNKIRYVIATSNFQEFVFPSDSEKLERRIGTGCSFAVDVVDPRTKVSVPFEKFSKFSQEERNSSWRLTVLNVVCSRKNLHFARSQKTLDFGTAMCMLTRSNKDYWGQQISHSERFSSERLRCACGLPNAMHYVPVTKRSKRVCDRPDIPERSFRLMSSACLRDGILNLHTHVDEDLLEYFECSGPVEFLIYAWFWFSVFVALFFVGVSRAEVYEKRYDYFGMLVNSRCAQFFLENGKKLDLVTAVRYYQIRGVQTFFRVRAVVYANYRIFLSTTFVIFVAFARRYFVAREDYSFLSAPIYSKQVDKESLAVCDYREEMSYPTAVARNWGKQEVPMQVARLVTKGVAEIDLLVLVKNQLLVGELWYTSALGVALCAKVQMFVISPEFVVFNRHYVIDHRTKQWKSDKFEFQWRQGIYFFYRSDIIVDDEVEIVLVRHKFPVVAKGMHKFLLEDFVQQSVACRVVSASKTATCIAHPALDKDKGGALYTWENFSVPGDCSSVVLGDYGGEWAIISFMSWGREESVVESQVGYRYGIGNAFTRKVFNRMCAKDASPFVEEVVIDSFVNPEDLVPLDVNSELRGTPNQNLLPLGTLVGGSRSFSSSIKRSMLYSDIAPLLSEPYSTPKQIRGMVGGVYASAWTTTFKHYGKLCDVSRSDVRRAMLKYLNICAPVDYVKEHGIKLSPLSFEEAIFGCPQIGVERVKFDTSCGPHLRSLGGIKNKYDCFEVVGELDDGELAYAFKPVVKNLVIKMLSSLAQGNACAPYMEFVPKDEVRPDSKLEAMKVRLFSVLCACYNLVGRMLMMPLINYLLHRPKMSWCYGGVNAGSSQWNDLAQLLKRFAKFFDMDFSSFDMSHDEILLHACCLFFFLLALRLGYSLESARAVYYFAISIKWQIVKYLCDVFIRFKGLPSGIIFTLIFNSLINSFLFLLGFEKLCGEDLNFTDHVVTANVGDDNVNGVSDEVSDRFNMLTFSSFLSGIGYTATPAQKNKVAVPVMSFEELMFLKRRFRFCKEIGEYKAPIDVDSMYKALCFEDRQAGVTPVERLKQVGYQLQLEAFLHGREFFDSFQNDIIGRIMNGKHHLSVQVLKYEEVAEWYALKSFSTFWC